MAYIYLTYSQNFPESDSLSFLCIRKIKQLSPCKEMAWLVNTLWWHRLVGILSYPTRKFYFVSFSELCKTVRKTGQLQRPRTIPSSQCSISKSYIRLLQLICSWETQVFPFLPYPTVMEKSVPCSPPFADFTASRPHGQVSWPEAGTSGGRGREATQQGHLPGRSPERPRAGPASVLAQHLSRAGRHRARRHQAQSKGCVPVLKG